MGKRRKTKALPVGIVEIAERLGVKRDTVDMWRARKLLPAPRWRVGGRPAWDWRDVEEWAWETGRLKREEKRKMRMVIDLEAEMDAVPGTVLAAGAEGVFLEAAERVAARRGVETAVLFAAHGSPEAVEFAGGGDPDEHADVWVEVCDEVDRLAREGRSAWLDGDELAREFVAAHPDGFDAWWDAEEAWAAFLDERGAHVLYRPGFPKQVVRDDDADDRR